MKLKDLMNDYIDSCINDIIIKVDKFSISIYLMESELSKFETCTTEILTSFRLKVGQSIRKYLKEYLNA